MEKPEKGGVTNLVSEKSDPGSTSSLYLESLFRSDVRSPRNDIDSVQRKRKKVYKNDGNDCYDDFATALRKIEVTM